MLELHFARPILSKEILILGGGFGGLAAADTVRKGLDSVSKVTLVDKQTLFFMGLTKLWIIDGRRRVGENAGDRNASVKRGVDFLEGEVTAIRLEDRQVSVGKRKLSFDYLIIALGADYSPEATPGFQKYATNLYTESGCSQIRDKLRSFDHGTLTVLVCGLPFKCPSAPYETAMIIDDVLRKRNVREKVKVQVITPEPHPLTILGPEAGKKVTGLLGERGIEYHPAQRIREIRAKSVLTESEEIEHDLVFAIPIHVAPRVLKDSGLVDQSGWVPVDPATMATSTQGVFAVGDCAGTKVPNGLLLPRAGVLAEKQGKVAAENIVNEIRGIKASAKFDGAGVCYMEVGGEKAAPVHSNFYHQPAPTWEFTPPSAEAYREKHRFLTDRMLAWFN
jgi:sulfide:quinone oxidoreductase